jgi:hypothetical protein
MLWHALLVKDIFIFNNNKNSRVGRLCTNSTSRLYAPQISRVATSIPTLDCTVYHLLPIGEHMGQIPLALIVQSHMPLVSSVSDDPVVSLLDDPVEVRSVVMPIRRRIAHEIVQQDRCFFVLEYKHGVVQVQVCGKRVIGSVEAVDSSQQGGRHNAQVTWNLQGDIRSVWVCEVSWGEAGTSMSVGDSIPNTRPRYVQGSGRS